MRRFAHGASVRWETPVTEPIIDQDHTAEDMETEINADSVETFLMRHPKFFVERPDLLDFVELPNQSDGSGVVDFQQFQLKRRDTEIDELRSTAQDVIETSRCNMSVQTRTHASVLALLHANTPQQLYRIVSDDLPILLDVDVAAVGFEPSETENVAVLSEHLRTLPPGTVDTILGKETDVQLYRDFWDDSTVFGSASGLVQSAAIARIKPTIFTPNGMLALGARDDTFAPGQGTELFSFLARVIEACVLRLSDQDK